MLVTINTDASYVHGYAGYAFWIVCNEFKVLKAGTLRSKVKRPELAEFKCIINALHILFKNDCKSVNKIIFNTDCLNVIHLLKKDKISIKKYGLKGYGFEDLVEKFYNILKNRKDIEIEFRHVKSHTGINDARSYVNEWCDREAKKYAKIRFNQN